MPDRDTFEEWLEEHKDEAIGRIEGDRFSLRRWIALLYKGLILESDEGEGKDDEDELLLDPDDQEEKWAPRRS